MRVATKKIHVNQHHIRFNKHKKQYDWECPAKPVLTTKFKGKTFTSNRASIMDEDGNTIATVVYSPDKPLSCGAKVWIETKERVKLDEISI